MKLTYLTWFCSTSLATALPRTCEQAWRFVGRVNPATQELTWPSTGVNFTFEGTQATIEIGSIVGNSSISLFIDQDEPIVVSDVTGSVSTPVLSKGRHTVELRKRSETELGTFRIVNIETDGKLVPTKRPSRQIEIIGDSISVGYGLDGEAPCVNSAALENNPKTYGALTAKAFDADYSVVAWSGKGLIRNFPSPTSAMEPLMPRLWRRYGANDEDDSYTFPATWRPDAVAINLGTNDFFNFTSNPVDTVEVRAAVVTLVENVHSHYPDAVVFLLSSTMLSDAGDKSPHDIHASILQAAVSELVDMVSVHFVEWPQQEGATGCDNHPNAETHAKGAAILINAVQEVLEW